MTTRAPSAAPARNVTLRRQGMATQVADELRRRILAGEMEEGAQLLQEQIAAEFGISKVPVREALHQLEAEGFVVQQYHRGATVAGLSPSEIMELFELRAQIEMWLLEVAMAKATLEDVLAASRLADEIAQAKDGHDFPELNWKFHEALYRPAGKPAVMEHLRKLHAQTERYVRMQLSPDLNKDELQSGHGELLELYSRKDPAARDRLRTHILGFAEELTTYLQKLKDIKQAAAGA
ncbi:GntR family transcriptional regulator [Hydrogenophaga sp.]|uniref:GntR family transcriptional regulator n=1 Tax=Hydrogenophaga sp. TaxID=1904254 RepID=UPI0027190F7D|nr:GntR family transcriptional regulator [Hydrogenophaga sp.]MDO9435702.1 GntR family transcriptional regulator [Hydrogenophaga sp.]